MNATTIFAEILCLILAGLLGAQICLYAIGRCGDANLLVVIISFAGAMVQKIAIDHIQNANDKPKRSGGGQNEGKKRTVHRAHKNDKHTVQVQYRHQYPMQENNLS